MEKPPQILNSEEKLTYRISAKGIVIITMVSNFYLLLVFSVMNFAMGNDPIIPWRILVVTLPMMILSVWSFNQIKIDNEGIRIFPMFVIKWDDVIEAKITNSFGLKYMRIISRRKGMNMGLILDRKGPLPIEVALKEKSPAGNPIHQLFA